MRGRHASQGQSTKKGAALLEKLDELSATMDRCLAIAEEFASFGSGIWNHFDTISDTSWSLWFSMR